MYKRTPVLLAYLFPRIQDAVFIGALLAIFAQGPRLLNGDGDLGRHITIGNYIRGTREIPTQDIFSHTMPGEPVVPHEWLAQLILGSVHNWMGLGGIVLMIAVLIATTFTLTYREMLRRNTFRLLALGLVILAALASSLHWLARPHIFTFLFTALWAYQLESDKNRIWRFTLIMLVWANTHGAFIVGFIILGAHLAGWLWEYMRGESTRAVGLRLGMVALSSFAVTLINPAGWRLWQTSLAYQGNRFLVNQTLEYQSPDFHNWSTWPFLGMLALGILGWGIGGKLRLHGAILFAGWTILSLYSARHIPLFAIITAPYLSNAIQPVAEKITTLQRVELRLRKVEHQLRGAFWPVTGVITLIVATHLQPNPANRFDPNRFPVHAVDWLSSHPQEGTMFNSFIWGGYLLYRLWPEQTVFIDGQTDFYGEELTREYLQVIFLDSGWERVLEKYEVTWILLPPDRPVVKALQKEKGWVEVYRDNTAIILRKP